jgi:hypothetical protein
MQPESRLPHVIIWAVAEARRLRLAAASSEGAPPQAGAGFHSTADSTRTAPCAPPAANRSLPQSLAFLVDWQLERV